MKIYRVRPYAEGGPVCVRTPWNGEGTMDVPNPAEDFAEDHPMVAEYPWLFRLYESDDPEPEGTETTTTRKRTTTRRATK